MRGRIEEEPEQRKVKPVFGVHRLCRKCNGRGTPNKNSLKPCKFCGGSGFEQ